MNSTFTHTQEALGRAARKSLQKDCPSDLIRQLYAGDRFGVRTTWRSLTKLGITGALVPKEFRGAGLSVVDTVPILQEIGRALVPGPIVETLALAAPLLDRVGTLEQKQRWLPAIASGEIAVTLALAGSDDPDSLVGIQTQAIRNEDSFVLRGVLKAVMDVDVADLLLIPARVQNGDSGITLFLVPTDTPGIAIEAFPGMDRTRHHSNVRLNDVRVAQGAVLGQVGEGGAPLGQALDIATVALCSTMVGGAERVLEMAAEYARTRQQYGHIIGRFQGIKHKCADMLVNVENSKSATYYAAWAVGTRQPNAPEAVSVAKNYTCQAYSYVSSENIQIHGGIGFTWEHEAHWYLKRAKANEVQLGSPRTHRERLASILGW